MKPIAIPAMTSKLATAILSFVLMFWGVAWRITHKSKIWKMNVFHNLYWAVAGSQDDGDFGECAANG